ncbi:helix-turn-helix domain-containing protein [Mucilaginibacter ginsenosidivorax]|uniref:AraC family transcriptional regulator n=1 Tax=Mucilaginibacter ginsenosidivorax TaxID=862126 RepID=A0A5B8W639_9SPHI|nr:helix-turn-helix domain-containing protein [Mucilaginibacter ginsenosidivorax]QEC78416.1 AraC family transcriptional regulator [Mucilaginibacter ginsenosidivorax]
MSKTKITTQPFSDFIPALKITDQFTVYERKEFARKTVPYNRRDFYKVSLTLSTGKLYYADKAVNIDRPALIFSNPRVPYAWEGICESQEGFFCLFSEDFLRGNNRDLNLQDTPLFKIGTDPVFFVDHAQLVYISGIFQNMLREFNSDYVYKLDLLRNHLNLLLHEALKMQPSVNYFKPQNALVRVASLFLELLERQFPVDTPQYQLKLRTANDYALHLSVHVNYLNRAVKEVTGKTTTEHLTERMVMEAKALLLHTDWSINDIAYSLGYEYPTYFNNFFKKQTGVTPSSLRQPNLV